MRMHRPLAALIVTGALLSCGCSIIKAQPSPTTLTGTMQGVVTGPSGPIASASVTVTASDATQHVGISDSGGFYSITAVPVGPATFAVRASGFSEYDGTIVINADPQTNRQDVSLNPQ
jgi:carboxypeptidase family protein